MRCQSCGAEFTGDACPACGAVASKNPFEQGSGGQQSAGPSPWQSPRAAPGVADGGPSGDDGIPWEREQSAQSLLETIKGVLLDAQSTFGRAAKNVGIGPAFIYVLILGIGGGLIGQLWSLATTGLMGSLAGMEGMEGLSALAGSGIAGFLLVPVWVVIWVFVVAGLCHLCLMMLGGANAGFDATFRVVAFAQGSAAPLQIVPVIGPLIGMVWGIVVEIMGLKELHNTTTGKAAGAVLLPLLICCCAAAGLGGVMAAMIGSAASGM